MAVMAWVVLNLWYAAESFDYKTFRVFYVFKKKKKRYPNHFRVLDGNVYRVFYNDATLNKLGF